MVRTRFFSSTGLAVLALASASASLWSTPTPAAIIFSDAFAYAAGSLSGNNGGAGWSNAWNGGTSQVTGSLPGTGGTSVRTSSDASVTDRIMASPQTTGSPTSYYLSFVFNANPFPASGQGDYAGVSLKGTGTSSANLFVGTPGSSGQLGFDWANEGDGLFAASNNMNYLTVLAIKPALTPGRTVVSLYASTNLLISGSSLIGGTALASLEGDSFSFGGVEIAGGYPSSSSINVAGLALATTVDEAVGFTQIAVPEPGSLLTMGVAATLLGVLTLNRASSHRRRSIERHATTTARPSSMPL